MEFKDYYAILGISRYSTADEIRTAYRTLSKKWHPDLNPGQDVTQKMQDINEAYAILKDFEKKGRYDYEYDNYYHSRYAPPDETGNVGRGYNQEYEFHDENLKQDIQDARKYAADLVKEFFDTLKKTSKTAARGAWNEVKGYVIAGIIISLIGACIATCSRNNNNDTTSYGSFSSYTPTPAPTTPNPTRLPTPQTTELSGFSTQSFFNAFSISVPATVERRRYDSPYSRNLRQNGIADIAPDVIMFNQKGLGNMTERAQNKYCRIIIQFMQGQVGDFLYNYETEVFDLEAHQVLQEMVLAEIGSAASLIGNISYNWIHVNNANGISVEYKRTGVQNDYSIPVCCKIILFQNNDKLVKMILSYREKEASLWERDFDVVLRSFKWIK